MARYNKYGFAPDQIIAESVSLPGSATNAALTNTVQIPACGTGMLKVVVCAGSAGLTMTGAQTIRFTPLFGTTAATCTIRAMGTIELKEGDVTLNNTAGSATTKDLPADSTWAAGDLITEFYIAPRLCKDYSYMDVNVAVSASMSSYNVEVYLVVE
jgi:hypothetical protein